MSSVEIYECPVVKDLGTLGGTSSYATAINEKGQVVGKSCIAGDVVEHAFIWENGFNYTDNIRRKPRH